MLRCPTIPVQRAFLLGTAFLLLVIASDSMAAPRLKRSDFYRYRSWATDFASSHVQTITTAKFPDASSTNHDDDLSSGQGRLMTAARSLLVVEDVLIREWSKSRRFTPDQSLATARSYRDVGEFAEALRWYRRSSLRHRDSNNDSGDIRREMFATAILSADSLLVTEEFLNLVGRTDLSKVEPTLVLAFRWMIAEDHGKNLDLLMRKTEGQIEKLGPNVQFWYSYVHAMREDRTACLKSLLNLLSAKDFSTELAPVQVSWVLRTIPDILYLEQKRDDALRLYPALEELPGETGSWARFQLANGYFLAGNYNKAQSLFSEFCSDPASTSWHTRACNMAAMMDQLASIQQEGVPYGTDSIHTR